MRFYVGLWLIHDINLKPSSSELTINVSIRSSDQEDMQNCIEFYRNCIGKFDKSDKNIRLDRYYGERILREGMNLNII